METGSKIAWAALGVAGVAAMLAFMNREGIVHDLEIIGYKNLNTNIYVPAHEKLDILDGDEVRVDFQYKYKGPALTGKYHVAFWQESGIDPHDELSPVEVLFSIPEQPDKATIQASVIIVNEGLAQKKYGIYAKIESVPGQDAHQWVANAVEVIDFDISLSSPTIVIPGVTAPGEVDINCFVYSRVPQNIEVNIKVYLGSLISSQILLDEQTTTIYLDENPKQIVFQHQAQIEHAGLIEVQERTIVTTVTYGGSGVLSRKDYPAFIVVSHDEVYNMMGISTLPQNVADGETVLITGQIKNNFAYERVADVKFTIYEGATIGTGDELDSYMVEDVLFPPYGTKAVTIEYDAYATSNNDRDVKVEVIENGQVMDTLEKADAFFVNG